MAHKIPRRMAATNNITPKDQYFRVVTGEGPDGGDEIFIYGFIGQEKWWEDDLTEPLTDLAVVQAIRAADAKNKPIHVRINSPGGRVLHGEAIVSAIASARNTVHTYVDGIAASMAWDIWMRGHVRHFPDNAKGMVHTSSTIGIGNAENMRATADMLDKFDEASIAHMAKETGLSEEEIKSRFYDYKDHWLSARDVLELGLIEKIETGGETRHVIHNPERLTYRELLQQVRAIETQTIQEQQASPEPVEDWRRQYLERLDYLNKIV